MRVTPMRKKRKHEKGNVVAAADMSCRLERVPLPTMNGCHRLDSTQTEKSLAAWDRVRPTGRGSLSSNLFMGYC